MSESLFKPYGEYSKAWNGKIVLLSDRHDPGKDIYFNCRYEPSSIKQIFFDQAVSSLSDQVEEGDFVVILRMVPATHLKVLQSLSERLSGVAWFIDDDIPAAWKDRHLPGGYGRRLTWNYLKIRHLLSQVVDRVWVSTQWLAEKYSLPPEHVIPAGYSAPDKIKPIVRYFYHGTKAHLREMQFLRPVVTEIQNKFDFARFEIFGDHEVYKLFRDIPGVTILHPMKWQKFKDYTANAQLDIGFAPVLDSEFNKARSHNKILDIYRCGAVGIYSELHAHADLIQERNAGLVVANDPNQWVDAFSRIMTMDRVVMERASGTLISELHNRIDLRQLILQDHQKKEGVL